MCVFLTCVNKSRNTFIISLALFSTLLSGISTSEWWIFYTFVIGN